MKHPKTTPPGPQAPTEPQRPLGDFREDLLLRAALAFVGNKTEADPHRKGR